MIVTCPQCSVQFKVDDALLGDDGRKVKCSSCKHVWHQNSETQKPEEADNFTVDLDAEENESEDDADSFEQVLNQLEEDIQEEDGEAEAAESPDADDDIDSGEQDDDPEDALQESESPESAQEETRPEIAEDIPDAVKPLPEENDADNAKVSGAVIEETKQSRMIAYSMSGGVFLLLLLLLLLSASDNMKRWPASIGFYNLFGIEEPAYGEGLSFDRIKIEKEGDYNLTLSGHILNLSDKVQPIPYIQAVLIDNGGAPLAAWFIDLPDDFLEEQETLSFRAQYTGLNKGARRVDLSFIREIPESMMAREGKTTAQDDSEKEDGKE